MSNNIVKYRYKNNPIKCPICNDIRFNEGETIELLTNKVNSVPCQNNKQISENIQITLNKFICSCYYCGFVLMFNNEPDKII